MAKYIENKNIGINKFNNIPELKDIGKAAQKFLSAIYSSGWDSLIGNKNNNLFRQKVLLKFTPKVNPVNTGKKENKNTDKPTSVKRLPLPIPNQIAQRSQ